MNTRNALAAMIAALSMAAAGGAFAQANPPSSTAGAGCTATANAMKGGNLGSSASDVNCTTAGSKAAAVAATPAAAPAAAPMTSSTTTNSTSMGSSATAADTTPAAPTRVARAARADRN